MSENQVVYLNVGGQLYATTEATLSSRHAEGSRLQAAVAAHVAHMRREAAAAGFVQAPPEIPLDPAHPGAVFLGWTLIPVCAQLPQVTMIAFGQRWLHLLAARVHTARSC